MRDFCSVELVSKCVKLLDDGKPLSPVFTFVRCPVHH